jgi:type IV pilus assembly protein PilO
MELPSSKKDFIIAGISLILVMAIIGGYFYFFLPLNQKITQGEAQLESEQTLLEAIQSQQINQSVFASPYEWQTLQRQVPVTPLVDQFLFDLEKAEIYSDSLILSYGFGEGEYFGTGISLTEINEENEEVGETEVETNPGETEATSSERITVTMSVVTPGYENLIDFLERIEQFERTTKIDQLSFTGRPEVTMVEQTADDINFSITISTFYLSGLAELKQYAPKIDYPEQGWRYNPLY